jgi:hypothetical protein
LLYNPGILLLFADGGALMAVAPGGNAGRGMNPVAGDGRRNPVGVLADVEADRSEGDYTAIFRSPDRLEARLSQAGSSQTLRLPVGKTKVPVPVPDELLKKNMLVEASAAGKTKVAPYFAGEMDVKLSENYGQLRVTDSAGGKPLSKVYVKVYAKLADGSVKFHKDGYTDLRGRFDYASVNTPSASRSSGSPCRSSATTAAPSSARPHPAAVRRSWWWRRPGIG